jgi:DNA helicase II / ATP-dependent DNA helicase PcrA
VNVQFLPTDEQSRIIACDGSAFVAACPGAGKTRVLVERARRLLKVGISKQGIAFLSFTEAAVSELEDRLRNEGLLSPPTLPSFIGTFDSFLWRFLVAPFGIPGSLVLPRLVPDIQSREVMPYANARPLTLKCFDRITGAPIARELARQSFDGHTSAYETTARTMRARFLRRGELDYEGARDIALARLRSQGPTSPLANAFRARFRELIVDEAQDCNPVDLEIIQWFRDTAMPVKVICDPHQSIYGFRGGVTDELFAFAAKFPEEERLSLTGNFRSSQNIVGAVATLRRRTGDTSADDALGPNKNESTPVYVLAYPGGSVPPSVGNHFRGLIAHLGLEPASCPVVAATKLSGARALGITVDEDVKDASYCLAAAVCDFHSSFEFGGRREALQAIHKIVLRLEGHLSTKTYHQHMLDIGGSHSKWRPDILSLARKLQYDPTVYPSPEAWLTHARTVLEQRLPAGSRTINQILQNRAGLQDALSVTPTHGLSARTIHSVKGAEFPAVCLVLSTRNTGQILDYLQSGQPAVSAEDARKIYVGASRAQRLLVIALPKSRADRMITLLKSGGKPVEIVTVKL